MNPPSEDVKDMLLAETALDLTFGTSTANLFVGREPSTPDNCVTIFDTPGLPPLLKLEPGTPYYRPSVHIRVRNRSYLTGYALALAIIEALHGRGPETWNSTTYLAIACVGEAALLDWDPNNRARFVTNFNIQRRA